MRGESFPGLGAGLAPAAIPSAPQDSPAGALPAWPCSALGSSKLRQVWQADSCFQTARDGYSQPS